MKNGQPFNPFGLFHGIFIPDAIKESTRLTSHAKLLMGQLLHYSGKDGKAFPSRKKLRENLNFSRNILDRSIKLLKEEQLIDTYQLTEHSPSTYIFLYNSAYYDVAHNSTGGVLTDENRGTIICEKRKEINKERDHKRKRINNFASQNKGKKKGTLRVEADASSLQGRGKLNGSDSLVKKKIKSLPKLKKIIVPDNPLHKFGFPLEVFEVLNYWRLSGGKIPKDPKKGRKIADNISHLIQALFLPGNNPYTSVLNESELEQFREKKWKMQEIKDSIDHYTKELCKNIESMPFNQFIIHQNFKNSTKKHLRDYSPLVLSFQQLPQQLSYLAKKLKEEFTYFYDEVHFYDKSFTNIGDFFEEKLIQYKPYIPHANLMFCVEHLPKLFLNFMDRQVIIEGKQDCLKYMSKDENLDNFIKHLSKLNVIKPRTDKELKNYKKEIKKEYLTQYNEYQKMINSGKAENWNAENWEYFEFLKEQVEC
jgi:hypothetical protein